MNSKAKLLKVLKDMPDEAFGWFVAWAGGAMMQYPDGLGGFRPESRKSIKALHEAAEDYIKGLTSGTHRTRL